MATTRASGYVVTHTVWNDVLSRLTDDGATYSGAFNGSTIAGTTLSLSGFATHYITAGGTGGQILYVRNTSAGTGNYSSLTVGNDGEVSAGFLQSLSTTFTTSGMNRADSVVLGSGRSGGLSVSAFHASGVIRLYTGGVSDGDERMRITAAGLVGIGTDSPESLLTVNTGATAEASSYAHIQSTRETATGQHLSLVRKGSAVWSLGFAYNTTTFAIGAGQTTDSNFTAAAAALTITSANLVSLNGGLALKDSQSLGGLSAGNNNNLDPGARVFLQYGAPATDADITGFSGGTDGRVLIVGEQTSLGGFVRLKNEDAASTAANRITSVSGATITLADGRCALLIYNGTTSRWLAYSLV